MEEDDRKFLFSLLADIILLKVFFLIIYHFLISVTILEVEFESVLVRWMNLEPAI